MKVKWRLASGVRWSGPLVVGVVLIVIAALVVLRGVGGVVMAAFEPSADASGQEALTKLLASHTDAQAVHRKRAEGRSFFFMPPAPPPPPPKDPPPPPPVETKEPVKPPPPATYTGPKPAACVGPIVFFADGMRLGVGEEKSGVRVVSTNPPWNVTLHHMERDYEVSIFDRPSETLFAGNLASFGTSSPSGITPAGDSRKTPEEGAAGSPPPAGAAPAADVPPPLGKGEIEKMDKKAAQAAFLAVSKARLNKNLDEATRTRLNEEHEWLLARLRVAK